MEATGKEYTVRYIRTRDTMPSGDKLERLADYLGTTVDWLLGKTDVQPVNAGAISPVISSEQFRRLPRDLPVYGTALGADLDLLTVAGESLGVEQIDVNLAAPTDHMARPLGAVGRNMYVVQIVGHSMEPRIDAGRRVLVDGSRAGRKGEDVVVQLRRMVGDHEEIYAVMVKQLVRQKSGSFVFHQFTPDVDFEIPVEVVAAVHPIIPWEDVLGF